LGETPTNGTSGAGISLPASRSLRSASASRRCWRGTGGLITALSFAVIGIAAATPLFFTLVTEYLSAAAAAACIALISSLGNLGPVVAPSINGWIVQHTAAPPTLSIS
jgi:MFS family permease